MVHSLRRNTTVEVKAIGAAVKGASGLLLHILVQASYIPCGDIGRIRDDNIELFLQGQLAKHIAAHKANASGHTDFFGILLGHDQRIHAYIHAHALGVGQVIQ